MPRQVPCCWAAATAQTQDLLLISFRAVAPSSRARRTRSTLCTKWICCGFHRAEWSLASAPFACIRDDTIFYSDKNSLNCTLFPDHTLLFPDPPILFPQILSARVLYSETFATLRTQSRRSHSSSTPPPPHSRGVVTCHGCS